MNDRRSFYSNLGPPDPIDYLRSVQHEDSETDWRRYDSDDEGLGGGGGMLDDDHSHQPLVDAIMAVSDTASDAVIDDEDYVSHPNDSHVAQEPPARERPSGDMWPFRETLSFTRSLIIYGAGSIT